MALGELSSAEDDATEQLIDVRLLVCDTLHQRHQQLQTHRDHSVAEPKIRAALFISEELGLTRDHTVSFIILSIILLYKCPLYSGLHLIAAARHVSIEW